MSITIKGETLEKIRALCSTISVAPHVDKDLRDELFTHLEEKLLGYITGEIKLTEEDAFILVREHFGKMPPVKKLLQRVYVSPACPAVSGRFVGFFAVRP